MNQPWWIPLHFSKGGRCWAGENLLFWFWWKSVAILVWGNVLPFLTGTILSKLLWSRMCTRYILLIDHVDHKLLSLSISLCFQHHWQYLEMRNYSLILKLAWNSKNGNVFAFYFSPTQESQKIFKAQNTMDTEAVKIKVRITSF